jgi:hypothetical protein
MLQPSQSMNDLTVYLGDLEKRIKGLEEENHQLRAALSNREGIDEDKVEKIILDYLPDTDLLHPSFFRRAFTVWGHMFVTNLIIGSIFFIIYICLFMGLLGHSFGILGR